MLVPATQLRVGALILYQDAPHRILDLIHVTPGNKRGFVQTKLRNLRSGLQTEHKFSSNDKVDRVTLEQREMEYLYATGDEYCFMNAADYEQIGLSSDILGDAVRYLVPNMTITLEVYDGEPVGVGLPKTVDLTVSDTPPAMKGATVNNELKPATMETGLVVRVPGFIEVGETIRVDTQTGEYVSRAK